LTVLELLAAVEDELVRGLDLRPVALPAELREARGSWKGEAVQLVARAYEGPRFRFCRFVELSGGAMSIANALCLPRRDLPLPVFGLDVVAPGHGGVMVAADLSPINGGPVPALPPHALPPGGALPGWCERVFSSNPLYTRVPIAQLGAAEEPILARVRALAAMRVAPADETQIAAAQRAYCAAHLEDDKGLGMLAHIFGAMWAERFLREVMFPA
jgi:phycocyanobilin:ferredoxin oxidoreductase